MTCTHTATTYAIAFAVNSADDLGDIEFTVRAKIIPVEVCVCVCVCVCVRARARVCVCVCVCPS
jgi:hypothetical protein